VDRRVHIARLSTEPFHRAPPPLRILNPDADPHPEPDISSSRRFELRCVGPSRVWTRLSTVCTASISLSREFELKRRLSTVCTSSISQQQGVAVLVAQRLLRGAVCCGVCRAAQQALHCTAQAQRLLSLLRSACCGTNLGICSGPCAFRAGRRGEAPRSPRDMHIRNERVHLCQKGVPSLHPCHEEI
jgi:hypothetical protein